MIGTIRKHSKTLWWIIIFCIIITFVYWGSQTSQTGGSGSGSRSLGRLAGETITPEKFQQAEREVKLGYFFSSGSWPGRGRTVAGFDVERETYYRLLLVQKQEEMGVFVGADVAATAASERLRSLNRGKPVPPDVFVKQVLAPENLTMLDFERYIRHELGIQQMASVLGLGGELVTPQEVRALYDRENQEIQAQVAFFSATNYLDSVKPTAEQIGEFYTNQMSRYRLPDRVQVNYVKFPLSNYLAEAIQKVNETTNLNELLEAVYQQRGGSNYYTDAKSPEEAKQRILKEEQEALALDFGRKKAVEFATILYATEPMRSENLITLAKQNGLTPLVSPPFSKDEPPVGLDVRADFLRVAFGLTAEEPFSQTLTGNDGVYLISLHTNLPSEIPSLESIRDQVTQDFRFNEAVTLARKAAMDFATTATNITSVPAFTAACAVAKLKPVTLPPFALNTRKLEQVEGHVSLQQFKQVAFSTAPGQMSQLQPSFDGAYVVFVQGKLPLDESKVAATLPAFTRSVRQTRRAEAFNDWFRHEGDKAFREVPYFQKPAQLSGLPTQ